MTVIDKLPNSQWNGFFSGTVYCQIISAFRLLADYCKIGVSLCEPHMYEQYSDHVCPYTSIVHLAVTFYTFLVNEMATTRADCEQ